jgi:hypothetical protein
MATIEFLFFLLPLGFAICILFEICYLYFNWDLRFVFYLRFEICFLLFPPRIYYN